MINYITNVHLEFGSLGLLPQELERVGIRRPLIVTDKGIIANGLLDKLLRILPSGISYEIYDGTTSNPTEAQVLSATKMFLDSKCDGMIGIGGGSPIDLAKGVAIMATHTGQLSDYSVMAGGRDKIGAQATPIIALPTTSGTGSEVSGGSLIILNDGRKLVFGSPHLVPKSAICDPVLTLGLPPMLTAATGMDAIAHCIETFLSPRFNPPAEGIALDGLERAWKYIERATADGADKEARLHMMSASTQGALAFQKGLGAVHSLSHPLGGLKVDGKTGLHHGTLNAVVMPAVLRFNACADTVKEQDKYTRLNRALGLGPEADPAVAIADMSKRLGLPSGLAQMGVSVEQLSAVADNALLDASHGTNPRVPSKQDYMDMLEQSM